MDRANALNNANVSDEKEITRIMFVRPTEQYPQETRALVKILSINSDLGFKDILPKYKLSYSYRVLSVS